MSKPPFSDTAAELRALQDRHVQYESRIRLLAGQRAKARYVDKLRILKCQCGNYIAKLTETTTICPSVNNVLTNQRNK